MSEPSFETAIHIAKGCFDYSGGYTFNDLEIFHHGIQTVINALEGYRNSGGSDLQSQVLARIGVLAELTEESQRLGLYDQQGQSNDTQL